MKAAQTAECFNPYYAGNRYLSALPTLNVKSPVSFQSLLCWKSVSKIAISSIVLSFGFVSILIMLEIGI